MSRRLFATALVAAALGAATAARADGPLDPYLPKSGTIEGHLMTFTLPPDDQAIARQFRVAVQNNMDWFKKAMTSNPPGQPLPYDRHMGITEAQYKQLLSMKTESHAGDIVKIAVKHAADGGVSFAPEGTGAAALKDVTFPPGEKTAVTPTGTLEVLSPIHQKDAAAPIGVWNGMEWAHVSDSDAEPSAKIAFGKRDEDGMGVMSYQVAPYGDHKATSVVVFYPLR